VAELFAGLEFAVLADELKVHELRTLHALLRVLLEDGRQKLSELPRYLLRSRVLDVVETSNLKNRLR
jgi:hypothetical protein